MLDPPAVAAGSVGLWFRGGPLSDLAHRLLPVGGPALPGRGVGRRRLGGDGGFRAAAGQLLVVLVVLVQQLPWTGGDKQTGPAQIGAPIPPEVTILDHVKS